jgi:hypothetical protein
MDIVFDDRATIDEPIDFETFAFASARRRVAAVAFNFGLAACGFGGLALVANPSTLLVWTVVGSLMATQLAALVFKHNSLGGEVAGCVPVRYDGSRLPLLNLIRREWTWSLALSIAAIASQLVFLPVTIGLQSAFGDITYVTETFESENGIRVGTVFQAIGPTLLGLWMLREMMRSPNHQTFYDRLVGAVVVKTRP